MEFKEIPQEKFYYDNLPNEIKNNYPFIKYDKSNKTLTFIKNPDCTLSISNIKSMYYLDAIFYIKSKIYTLVIWNDIKTWQLIKSV